MTRPADILATARRAAEVIQQADGLLVCAGAGMGIDSGLPDFRGPQGFWQAYPALGAAKLRFEEIASPHAFRERPDMAWGFYGHRLALYRRTQPHRGFEILRNIAERMPQGGFVYTSNVDGQFQKAGFATERVKECHGSIHWLQCLEPCTSALWRAGFDPMIDEAACRMTSPLPRCPHCDGLARPNIMMFHDWGWIEDRAREQSRGWTRWRAGVERLAIIELGAGTHIPSVRMFAVDAAEHGFLVRINSREPERPPGIRGLSLAAGALTAMEAINDALFELGFWAGG